MIKVICAYCAKQYGTKPGSGDATHGICDGCLPGELAKVKKMKEEREAKKKVTTRRGG